MADSDHPIEVRSLGRTLRRWHNQIVAWHHARVSNGPTEAVNNLIKRIKRIGACATPEPLDFSPRATNASTPGAKPSSSDCSKPVTYTARCASRGHAKETIRGIYGIDDPTEADAFVAELAGNLLNIEAPRVW